MLTIQQKKLGVFLVPSKSPTEVLNANLKMNLDMTYSH